MLEQEIRDERSKRNESENNLQLLKQKYEVLETLKDQLNTEFKKARLNSEDLKSNSKNEIHELEKQTLLLSDRNQELEEELKALKEVKQQMDVLYRTLEKEKDFLERTNHKLNQKLIELEAENNTLRIENSDQSRRLNSRDYPLRNQPIARHFYPEEGQARKNPSEDSLSQSDYDKITEASTQKAIEMSKLEAQIQELENTVDQKEKDLEKVQNDLWQQIDENSKQQELINKFKEESNKLEDDLQFEKDKNSHLADAVEEGNKKVRELEERLEEVVKEIELFRRRSEIQKTENNKSDDVSMVVDYNDPESPNLEEIDAANLHESIVKDLNSRYDSLTQALNSDKQEISELKEQNQTLTKTVEQKESKISKLKDKMLKLKKEICQHESDTQELVDDFNKLREKYKGVKKENKNLKADLADPQKLLEIVQNNLSQGKTPEPKSDAKEEEKTNKPKHKKKTKKGKNTKKSQRTSPRKATNYNAKSLYAQVRNFENIRFHKILGKLRRRGQQR